MDRLVDNRNLLAHVMSVSSVTIDACGFFKLQIFSRLLIKLGSVSLFTEMIVRVYGDFCSPLIFVSMHNHGGDCGCF